jgi:hypothetical protein
LDGSSGQVEAWKEGSPGIAMVNASFQITRECVANLIGVYNTRMSVVRPFIVLSLYSILYGNETQVLIEIKIHQKN